MAKIRVTRQFSFEMSHALYNYDGLCRSIHGHSYKLRITLLGEPLNQPGHPKDGMVMDFGLLKKLIKEQIVNPLDHSLLINRQATAGRLPEPTEMFERASLVDFQPTTENLVIYLAEKAKGFLPSGLELHSIRLYETSNSYAEWFASDNC